MIKNIKFDDTVTPDYAKQTNVERLGAPRVAQSG